MMQEGCFIFKRLVRTVRSLAGSNAGLLRLAAGDFCHGFFKLKEKQDGSEGNSQDICNRLSHINCICLISTENIGQDIDQRDDQHKFPDNSHNDGILGSAKGDKGHLAGNLDTKDKHNCHIDPESCLCESK